MHDENPKSVLNLGDAFSCLAEGLTLAFSKQCRAYVIIPVLVNLLLLSLGGYTAFCLVKNVIFSWVANLPDYLMFLAYAVSVIAALMIVFVCCYFFSTVASIIASPFYGLLADKAEMAIRGTCSDDSGLYDVIRDIPRCLKREMHKQIFFLPRALLCLVISLIPGINLISPVPWFLLGSWMGCLQYVDYAYDNHKISFAKMKSDLKHERLPTFIIGAVIALGTAIPLINLIVPPAAVCAGTRYYVMLQKDGSDVLKR